VIVQILVASPCARMSRPGSSLPVLKNAVSIDITSSNGRASGNPSHQDLAVALDICA